MKARNKLSAEAVLKEEKIILGWHINFCCLIISLPDNKFIAWMDSIKEILSHGTSTAKELETMIGHLGHLSAIITFVYYFLSRLRDLQWKATKQRSIAIPQPFQDDLKLMLVFLHKAFTGINMNLISFRCPTDIYQSDSCPYGLRGYSHKVFAWRLDLQEQHHFRASNNHLKFIASIITPWIDMILKHLQPGDCVLSMTGSTTSLGWLKKTKFSEAVMDATKSTIRLEIARKRAGLFIHHNIEEYSQWFLGKKNNVADALSWDFDLSDAELTKTLCLHHPSQLPPHFQVVPLPREIELWLTSLLLQLPMKEQLWEQHMKTKLGPTDDGSNTTNQLASPTTPSLTDLTDANETSSSVPLQQQSEKNDFQATLSKPWLL
jgi:hypothetical protein